MSCVLSERLAPSEPEGGGHGNAERGHSEEQILRALRQVESGTKVSDVCCEQGISAATFYFWKKYAGES
jgi:hypothetical protein